MANSIVTTQHVLLAKTMREDARLELTREMALKKFKANAWTLTTLPAGFWTPVKPSHLQPGQDLQALEGKGLHALHRLIFGDIRASLPATEAEFEAVAEAITSAETLDDFFKLFGDHDDCKGSKCPRHIPGPALAIDKAFRIYVGALIFQADSDDLGYFRFKPWGMRLFDGLAKIALTGIRPHAFGETKKRIVTRKVKGETASRKKTIKRPVNVRTPLADKSNAKAPATPPTLLTPATPQSPSSTLSPAQPPLTFANRVQAPVSLPATALASPSTTTAPSTTAPSAAPATTLAVLIPSSPGSCAIRRQKRVDARRERKLLRDPIKGPATMCNTTYLPTCNCFRLDILMAKKHSSRSLVKTGRSATVPQQLLAIDYQEGKRGLCEVPMTDRWAEVVKDLRQREQEMQTLHFILGEFLRISPADRRQDASDQAPLWGTTAAAVDRIFENPVEAQQHPAPLLESTNYSESQTNSTRFRDSDIQDLWGAEVDEAGSTGDEREKRDGGGRSFANSHPVQSSSSLLKVSSRRASSTSDSVKIVLSEIAPRGRHSLLQPNTSEPQPRPRLPCVAIRATTANEHDRVDELILGEPWIGNASRRVLFSVAALKPDFLLSSAMVCRAWARTSISFHTPAAYFLERNSRVRVVVDDAGIVAKLAFYVRGSGLRMVPNPLSTYAGPVCCLLWPRASQNDTLSYKSSLDGKRTKIDNLSFKDIDGFLFLPDVDVAISRGNASISAANLRDLEKLGRLHLFAPILPPDVAVAVKRCGVYYGVKRPLFEGNTEVDRPRGRKLSLSLCCARGIGRVDAVACLTGGARYLLVGGTDTLQTFISALPKSFCSLPAQMPTCGQIVEPAHGGSDCITSSTSRMEDVAGASNDTRPM
ncbi:hypothetical protein C8R46DRAFT_1308330 [Mycena filopes]|nr:hypothetical protein C8R46DRAFT_1308330 [Mycena filopes]